MIFTIILLVLLIPILAIVLDSQVGQALASRLEQRRLGEADGLSAERMAFLETEVERLSVELARIDEESRFVTRLLTERAGGDEELRRALPDAESSATDSGGEEG